MSTILCEGAVFDLDGVVTGTARTHFNAWKETFDAYLSGRTDLPEEARGPFTHEGDYIPYVDGKPRYDGVRSFLESRGVHLEFGDPGDTPGENTICGVGNQKNEQFRKIVERDGVDIYDSTVEYIDALRERGVKVGVASSSKNATFILEKTGLYARFGTVVDGNTSAELGLSGKPAPDIFLTAAERLGVTASRSLMVEDAYSGVEAGRNGKFGLVIGIAREGDPEELRSRGAHVVVRDMSEYSIEETEAWFSGA